MTEPTNSPTFSPGFFLFLGIVLQVAGAFFAVANWPDTTTTPARGCSESSIYGPMTGGECDPKVTKEGSKAVTSLALVGAGAGSVMTLIGCVGAGVVVGGQMNRWIEAGKPRPSYRNDPPQSKA